MRSKLMLLALLASSCVTHEKGLTCPGTIMEGWAKPEDMTKNDHDIYESAKLNCPLRYPDRRSPCVKKLVKTGENRYFVLCGRPK